MSAQTIDHLAPTTAPALPRQRAAAPQRPGHLALVPDLVPTRRTLRPATGAVQLTRRGRLLLLVVVLALGAVFAFAVTGLVDRAGSGAAATPPVTRSVVVQPGQTLWSIAREVDPSADRRNVIAQIVELNALPSTDVAAGTRLTVPTR